MTLEEIIAHHRWCADNCEGEVREEHLQMADWLEELVELRAWNSEFGCSMHDYNRGALKEPCLRLDYGFGEQWASVELGDGTGYVRLSDYEKVTAENDKLRELARKQDALTKAVHAYWAGGEGSLDDFNVMMGANAQVLSLMRELGIEADDE